MRCPKCNNILIREMIYVNGEETYIYKCNNCDYFKFET